ncbi:MAG: glycerophosphodiester phosphodiesterase family protein [Negativicutes bacterium]|nr:glycerophosphodiester phosphodiesterase family protein [Negativicutes bacterium]
MASFVKLLGATDIPLIGAHRGASAIQPENTLAAFRAAVMRGADFIELDVQLSKDGVPVVIHDFTLDRTTSAVGPVAAATADEIKQAGPVPTLQEVFEELAGKTRFNIELKTMRLEFELVRKTLLLIRKYNIENDVLISSFEHKTLAAVCEMDASLPTGVLYERPLANPIAYACSLKAAALHPAYRLANRKLITDCRQAHLPVIVWTVDKASSLRYFGSLKVNGIISNKPDVALALLAKQ